MCKLKGVTNETHIRKPSFFEFWGLDPKAADLKVRVPGLGFSVPGLGFKA